MSKGTKPVATVREGDETFEIELPIADKEPMWQSDRFRLTMIGVLVNVGIVILAKYLEMDPAELIALVAGNTGLFGNMVVQRTKRNTIV